MPRTSHFSKGSLKGSGLNGYCGELLPVLFTTRSKMKEMKEILHSQHTKNIAYTALSGLERRFQKCLYLGDKAAIITSFVATRTSNLGCHAVVCMTRVVCSCKPLSTYPRCPSRSVLRNQMKVTHSLPLPIALRQPKCQVGSESALRCFAASKTIAPLSECSMSTLLSSVVLPGSIPT